MCIDTNHTVIHFTLTLFADVVRLLDQVHPHTRHWLVETTREQLVAVRRLLHHTYIFVVQFNLRRQFNIRVCIHVWFINIIINIIIIIKFLPTTPPYIPHILIKQVPIHQPDWYHFTCTLPHVIVLLTSKIDTHGSAHMFNLMFMHDLSCP